MSRQLPQIIKQSQSNLPQDFMTTTVAPPETKGAKVTQAPHQTQTSVKPQQPEQSGQPETIIPPSFPGEWTMAQTTKVLSRTPPASMVRTLRDKGNASYVPWYTTCKVLDKYTPGWEWHVIQMTATNDRLFVVGRLSIITKDRGIVSRDATGTEVLKKTHLDKRTGEIEEKEISYGDPSSNAESMAFRRAAAKFGFCLCFYDKKK